MLSQFRLLIFTILACKEKAGADGSAAACAAKAVTLATAEAITHTCSVTANVFAVFYFFFRE